MAYLGLYCTTSVKCRVALPSSLVASTVYLLSACNEGKWHEDKESSIDTCLPPSSRLALVIWSTPAVCVRRLLSRALEAAGMKA